jgi:predicted transcriptional regulator of viral defense system
MVKADPLYVLAASQEGLFTTAQAEAAGYSRQLLRHHVLGGTFLRVRRSIYRFVQFPAGDHEDLVVVWLWSAQQGVVSHQSALCLHELSDALPARLHLTIPATARSRRRAPRDVQVHHADIPRGDRTWFGPVPVTTVTRTLEDCAHDGLTPDLLRQATHQALRRGLTTIERLPAVLAALAPFGGLAS